MGRLRALSIILTLVAAGCLYKPPAVPLLVEPRSSLEALVGEWTGDYTVDDEYERTGRISFALKAGEDHAYGDVLMVPSGRPRGYDRYQGAPPPRPDANSRPAEALSIRFVRVFGGGVSGLLDTYWDPDRNCQVSTTFVGDVKGDVIEGTFRSHFTELASEATGHWRVTRRVSGR
jgi:hypothetical protein